MATKRELAKAEDEGWMHYLGLIECLSDRQAEEPGYFPEGWSVKDLLAHVGCWQAEAGQILRQIRFGTYRNEPVDVDAMNQQFYEVYRDIPLPVIRAESFSARTRMLVEWNALLEMDPVAQEWFEESGAKHYDEHVPRLRDWVEELRSRV